MAERLLLDSDVLIDYLRGAAEAVEWLEARSEVLLRSAISVAELYAGVREGRERAALGAFLSAFEIVAVDRQIAEAGGLYRRDYGRSRHTGLADALIAATAEARQALLVTLNRKPFPMMPDVLVPYRKSPPA
jgi:predicted nucleic acid-binding protein